MSGFVGLVMADGAPVDRELLEEMTEFLAFRGLHGQSSWADGSVGLGHTLLRTTDESEHERQPTTLDGEVWIAADARIDRRRDLARELGLGLEVLASPDCYLILHAYARWGERCVEHLVGDFAFAIWDRREGKLFCARDHLGVKPFYYARVRGGLIVSNTLNCIRLHPDVSDRLNELAVADYLLFTVNQDLATTTFADILRLPPAHALSCTSGRATVRRYWSLPSGNLIRYRRTREYIEHFGTLLEQAVRDRVRSGRASIFFSGGIDSTAVAAIARRVSPSVSIRAVTAVTEHLVPEDEGPYAALAARHLGIPLELMPVDDFGLFDRPDLHATPEPLDDPRWPASLSLYRLVADHAPVVLTGQGGDPLFTLSRVLNGAALRQLPVSQLLAVLVGYTLDQRRIPRFRLRGTFRHLAGLDPDPRPLPVYLNADFINKHDLEHRRRTVLRRAGATHPWRPDAAATITDPFWPSYFEIADPGWTGTLVEEWHPLFSSPLVQFIMSVPEVPFCVDKYLLRRCASGLLPEEIRRRPKTPVRVSPNAVLMRRAHIRRSDKFRLSRARLGEFVNVQVLTSSMRDDDESNYAYCRAYSLDLWLAHQSKGELRCPTLPIRRVQSTEHPC